MSVPRYFHRFWFAAFIILVGVEAWAIFRHGAGDTLSEWTWSKISQWPLRMAVSALLGWLLYHFIWRGPRGLSKLDLAAALAGAAFGLVACRYGWR